MYKKNTNDILNDQRARTHTGADHYSRIQKQAKTQRGQVMGQCIIWSRSERKRP